MNNSSLKILIPAAVVTVLIILGFIFFQQARLPAPERSDGGQVKSAHFVDSTPLHGETYVAQPVNTTINFNFDLQEGSKISVTSADGKEWTEGDALIEDQKTALKKNLKQDMPDGGYRVSYTACWPDGSCHEGQFSFKIDSTKKSEYQDLRGKKELTIKMKEVKFDQNKIIISPGTEVTWVNEDNFGHFVNTETHPEHTYYPEQNSRELTKGKTYSVTFQTPGQYNYHCSAHVPEGMVASLIVSN